MTVTSRLFGAYLKCPTKCFLWSRGQTGTGNAYADWTHAQNLSCQLEGVTRIREGVANNECITGRLDRKDLKFAKWRLAINSKMCAQDLESTIHAVERVPSATPGEPAQFIPIFGLAAFMELIGITMFVFGLITRSGAKREARRIGVQW